MKKSLLTTILISSFALVTVHLASCKKEEPKPPTVKETPKPPTNEDMVMSNTWKISRFMSQGLDVWNNPLVPIFEPCMKDNLYEFQKDNILLIDEGETKCDSTSAQTMEGAWFMVGDDKMFINVIFLSDTADIVSVSKTQLVLKANIESFGVDGEITFNKVE